LYQVEWLYHSEPSLSGDIGGKMFLVNLVRAKDAKGRFLLGLALGEEEDACSAPAVLHVFSVSACVATWLALL